MPGYTGIEPGLSEANRRYIRYNRHETHKTKIKVERIVKKILGAMKLQSPGAFAKLRPKIFGGGSSYEGLKVGEGADFDMDILLQVPEVALPDLREDTIPGYVQLNLVHFQALQAEYHELYREMTGFVDEGNYLLTTPMKTRFIQSIFDRARHNFFPDGITLGNRRYTILSVQNVGPALTLTIQGVNVDFSVQIDLVPCILLTKNHWPRGGFRSNPYLEPSDFFIVPKNPKRSHHHIDRYFRLSFQKQERKIILDRNRLKPTIRVLKCMRDHFGHAVSSYAIKTIFLWELFVGNQALDDNTPRLWEGPFGDCVVHMLQRYLECLENHKIPYFWNKKLNLLDNLSYEQIEECRRDMARVLDDIEENPTPETVLACLTR